MALCERYLPPESVSSTDNYLKDLTVQISVQAHSADRKFKAFNRAGRLVIAAFGVLTVPVVNTLASLGARYAIAQGWL